MDPDLDQTVMARDHEDHITSTFQTVTAQAQALVVARLRDPRRATGPVTAHHREAPDPRARDHRADHPSSKEDPHQADQEDHQEEAARP